MVPLPAPRATRLGLVLALAFAAHAAPPDLVVVNARIHTMNSTNRVVEAMAIEGERIVKIGTAAEIAALGKPARTLDAQGRTIVPGFNDAHVHFIEGGFQLSSVDLRDASTKDEFVRRIAEFAKRLPQGRWVTGGDWDHESWPGAPLPRRQWIDEATGTTPVFVNRLDGHMALANTAALRLAGITKDTPDPPGGLIVRDETTGEPTGILKDAAMTAVYKVIPEPSFEARLDAARAATKFAASLGVTSVQDMSAGANVGIYQELLKRGELLTRVYAVWPLPRWRELATTGIRQGFGNAMLRTGGLKGFADGSLGSTTALFFEPYNDAPNTSGLASDELLDPGKMEARVRGAAAAGLQVMIHAIGDRANDRILSIYEQAERDQSRTDQRFRIEHAQHLREADIARFAKLHVIASMQPTHEADDGRWAEKRIGAARAHGTYAFRALLDTGAALAFGTDWSVAPLNPMLGLKAAVTRQTNDGKHPQGWVPEQKISIDEAVRAYTVGSAYAEFQERDKGTLEAGKLADFVVLSDDIFSIDATRIDKTHVVTTVVGGKIVYTAK